MSESTTQQSATTANRIDCCAVQELESFVSEENPRNGLKLYEQKQSNFEAQTLAKISSVMECRVSRIFTNITYIKSIQVFTNAWSKKQFTAQFLHLEGLDTFILKECLWAAGIIESWEQYHSGLHVNEESETFEHFIEVSVRPKTLADVD